LQYHRRSGASLSPAIERDDRIVPIVPRLEDDQALVHALLEGDPRAPSVLFDRYGAHLQKVLARVLGYGEPERADLLHDVFVRALERMSDLKNPRALKAWLTGIAVFTAQEWIRRRKRTGPPVTPDAALDREGPALEPEAIEAVRSFYAAMARLRDDERAVFILRFVEGMNLHEIADACQISFSTVRRRVSRAEDRFHRMLAEYPALLERLKERTL
jgi:RNA polymerase sigma-70 factor (ECF subfamily)